MATLREFARKLAEEKGLDGKSPIVEKDFECGSMYYGKLLTLEDGSVVLRARRLDKKEEVKDLRFFPEPIENRKALEVILELGRYAAEEDSAILWTKRGQKENEIVVGIAIYTPSGIVELESDSTIPAAF